MGGGATISEGNPLLKNDLRFISNSNYIVHTEPIWKKIVIVKAHRYVFDSSLEILLHINE